MGLNEKILYDSFNNYYKKATEAREKGDQHKERAYLIEAAQMLLKLAKLSDGELKKARFERAERILHVVEQLTKEETLKNNTNQRAKVSSDKAKESKEESDDNKFLKPVAIPNIKFSDVAGLEDVKKTIQTRVILAKENKELYDAFGKKTGGGVLLYGPPGTGKTMIAKAIANEVGAKFFPVKCSDIVAKWFGESEQNIKELFEAARQYKEAVIFFDEVEALMPTRDTHSTVMKRIVPTLLAEMDGFVANEGTLLLLGATNRPWDIDQAIMRPGRLNEHIYVPLPDEEARKFIIKTSLGKAPLDENLTIDWLVSETEGYSGADTEELCDRMKEEPLRRSINDGVIRNITLEDAKEALQLVRPSVSQDDLLEYTNFKNSKIK